MNKIYNERFDETYYTETLANGLQVTIIHKPDFLTTTACFATPYGSLGINQKFNGENKNYNPGIAHFIEHKLFEAEGKDIMNRFSELGANVNAFTSYTETVYFFTKTADNVDDCLNLLLDFVQDLDITEESVEKEKGIIVEEVSMYLQDPNTQLINESFKSMYLNYPFNKDIGGDKQSVNRITKAELEDCYSINYHPSNMHFVVISPIDPEHIIDVIKTNQNAKNFTAQDRPVSNNDPEPKEVVRKEYELEMDVNKGKSSYAIKIEPHFNDNQEAHKTDVATTLYLSCYFTSLNPNYQKWMDEGIINDMFGFETYFTKEAAYIIFYMESDDKEALKKLVDNELSKDLVTSEKIEQLRKRLIGSSYKVFNDIEDYATGYTRDIVNGIDYFKEINSIVNMKKDEIVSIFKGLDLSNYSLVHISPVDKCKK